MLIIWVCDVSNTYMALLLGIETILNEGVDCRGDVLGHIDDGRADELEVFLVLSCLGVLLLVRLVVGCSLPRKFLVNWVPSCSCSFSVLDLELLFDNGIERLPLCPSFCILVGDCHWSAV